MYNKKSYAMSSAIVKLGYWTKSVEDNAELILSVIDLLRTFDKLNDDTTYDKNVFIDFITDCSSKTIDKIVSMDLKQLLQFDPWEYNKNCDIIMTPELIMSKIKICDLNMMDDKELQEMVENVIKSFDDFKLKDGTKEKVIERLRKIKTFIEDNHISIEEDCFESCLIFEIKQDIVLERCPNIED